MIKIGWYWKKINYIWGCVIVFCIVNILGGCKYTSEIKENIEDISNINIMEEHTEMRQEEIVEEIYQRIKDIDFNIKESPIDKDQYNSQTDRIYKTAFLNALTNQIPIQYLDREETFYYKDLIHYGEELDENGLPKYMKQSDYYYQDFDNDGYPEMIVNTEGPCVLKYDSLKDKVELYYRKEQGWNLLGARQMFYESYSDNYLDNSSGKYAENVHVIEREYAYEMVDCNDVKLEVIFYHTMMSNRWGSWVNTYKVSINEFREIELSEDKWSELITDYFLKKSQAPHPMSFSKMFGEDESIGYMPGSEPWPRYFLENVKALPMNEETAKEWEAYKAMLEGDFSLLESEQRTSLQSRYESSLENKNRRCDWSYILMDFNQDGRKELGIKFNRKEYNDTAFFRYEDGCIKMWGSYDSADSHGFEIPLINGRMLSVEWYQDEKIMCVMRLDSECNYIEERCYYFNGDESEGKQCYYEFQDYYYDGQPYGSKIELSKEVWEQIEDMIENLYIPKKAWQPCSVFTPKTDTKKNDIETVNETIEKQLQVIIDNYDHFGLDKNENYWYEYVRYYNYAITDLDQNGRLELIVSVEEGSGRYTSSTYYEVNEAFDGMYKLDDSMIHSYSEADIIGESGVPVYYDLDKHIYYYIFNDTIRDGAGYNYVNKRAIWLKNGKLKDYILAYQDWYKEENTCTDVNGNEISESEYNNIADIVFPDLIKKEVYFYWFHLNDIESNDLNTILRQSYQGFHIQ